MIKNEKGKWYLYSKDGSKKLGGPYDTEEEAMKREKEVEHFDSEEVAMKGRGIVKVAAAPVEAQECGDMAYGSIGPIVPLEATSFSDLEQFEQAQDIAHEMQELNAKLTGLIQNVLLNYGIADRVGALYALIYEYSLLLPETAQGSTPMQSNEAATVKAAVRAAVKALSTLLEDRSLPTAIVRQVNALKESFKKTWADLEAEAGEEIPGIETTPPEAPAPQEAASEESAAEQEAQAEAGGEQAATEEGEQAEEPASERLAEDFGGDISIASEAQPSSALDLQVVLIQPGWGNSRDNHYYPRELLTAPNTAEKFLGAKMYESDHRPSEKSTRSWVSTITGIEGYTEAGAPIARVAVHDPGFAQRLTNLNEKGLLKKMECSILADAIAERGVYTEGGRQGKKILEITGVESVDWVTRAGAGGHALMLAEVDAEAETDAKGGVQKMLTKEEVQEFLKGTKLPQVAQARIEEGEYESQEALQEGIDKETLYIKEVTRSGKPFGVGESAAPDKKPGMSQDEYNQRLAEIDKRYLQ